MAKFLIIRFSSIGDIVLTTPVVRCLKKQIPDAEIHFLTKKQFAFIIENNPYVDKVKTLDNSLKETIKSLKKEKYDVVIDLHKNIRTLRVKLGLGVNSYSFNKLNREKWLLVNMRKNLLPNIHIVDRYMETLRDFGVKNDAKGLDYFIPENITIASFPEFLQKPYIALVIGANHATKQMPNEQISLLCRQINKPIVLLGGRDVMTKGDEIVVGAGSHVLNLCGRYSLDQSAMIVKHAVLVIAHDTGLMHIAAAFKKIIFSIWGNTIPEFGMYPYLSDAASCIFEVKGLNCRPCSKIGFKQCPKGHFHCMKKQDIEAITSAANTIWDRSVNP